MTALVEVTDVTKAYGDTSAPVLDRASFRLVAGESVSLVGASGAGKSTLLAILAGLMTPDSGTVDIGGRRVTDMGEDERARLRARDVGVVMQSDNLIPFLTGVENVDLALGFARGGRGARAPVTRARELLGELGLAQRADDYPRRLSGGEAQRVALAVALANDPLMLLADEVTGELDSVTAERVVDTLLDESARRGLAVLLVTHSPELAARVDRGLRLVDGAVVEA